MAVAGRVPGVFVSPPLCQTPRGWDNQRRRARAVQRPLWQPGNSRTAGATVHLCSQNRCSGQLTCTFHFVHVLNGGPAYGRVLHGSERRRDIVAAESASVARPACCMCWHSPLVSWFVCIPLPKRSLFM